MRAAHDLAQDIEDEIGRVLPGTVVSIPSNPGGPAGMGRYPRGAEHPMRSSQTRFGDGDTAG